MGKTLAAKKTCCGDRPRCRNCPVVLARLEDAGVAERVGKRRWRLVTAPSKLQLMAARVR